FQYGVTYDNTINNFPKFYVETVLPIKQTDDKERTLFTHDRISSDGDGNVLLNGGLGYRRLLFDDNLLAGANTFFDYQSLHNHYRLGMGLELKTKTLEALANYYHALSPRRQIRSSFFNTFYEKAVDGFDLELGGPVPYLPWLKLFGGYTRFFHD